jgi:hypothetical protein
MTAVGVRRTSAWKVRPNDRETLAFGRLTEPVIEGDEGKGSGLILRRDDCRRKLERISGTQRMDAQEPNSDLPNALAWLDLRPYQ